MTAGTTIRSKPYEQALPQHPIVCKKLKLVYIHPYGEVNLLSAAPTYSRKPTILLADDCQPMLRTVSGIVAPHFEVVAAVSDGQAALDETARTKPDLLLSDISMPRLNGLQAARELDKRDLRTKVVFLTALDDDDYISEALSAGAKGYVFKRLMQSDLVPALNLTLAGHFFISPYAFTSTPQFKGDTHALHLYSDENIFFEQASQLAYDALNKSGRILMFMSKRGIDFVRKRLIAMGLDSSEVIERGDLRALSVENLLPALMTRRANSEAVSVSGQLSQFESFFSWFFNRADDRSHKGTSNYVIISDLTATLLEHGYSHQFAAYVEKVWNELVPNQSCTVYCGCPAAYLGSRANRQTLAGICAQHSNVIAFDR